MNRITLAGVLVSLSSIGVAQDLDAKVTVEIPAARASVALAALSKATGVTFEPAANLKDDVFVISAHNATVAEVMKRIAQAEAGVWLQQSGAYVLSRDHSTTVTQERDEIAARASAIREAIDKLNAKVSGLPKFDQAEAQKLAEETHRVLDQATQSPAPRGNLSVNGADQKTPTARAIAHILASIDPAKLAQIGLNQRVVFSTNPTPMQRGLNNRGYEAFLQFVAEQLLYTRAYTAGQTPDDQTRRMVMINGLGTPTMGAGDPRLGLGVGLVIVNRRFDSRLDIQILAADTKLETLSTGSFNLQLTQPATTQNAGAGEEPLKISDEAKEMAKALGGGAGGAAPARRAVFAVSGSGGDFTFQSAGSPSATPKISPELRAKVLDPVKYDPLSFVPGEAMLALSRQSGKNLVALLPDYSFNSLSRQFVANVTVSQLLGSLGPAHSLTSRQDGDWIVVSPGLPASGRAGMVNRTALRSLLQAMAKAGSLHLDDVAGFALAEPKTPGMNDIDMLYPQLISNAITDHDLMPLAMGSDSLYKLYATLAPQQRNALAASRQLPFMNLGPQQLELISDILYNSFQGPEVRLDDQQASGQVTSGITLTIGGQRTGQMPMMFGGAVSAKTERTIVMPNGVVGNGFIAGSASSQQVVQGIDSRTGATAILDVGSLAFSRSSAGQADLAPFGTSLYDRFRSAHQTNLMLRFVFNPRVSATRSLSDSSPDADAQAVPYDSLPAAFRQQVDQMAQQMQRGFQQIPGQRGTPPPRR